MRTTEYSNRPSRPTLAVLLVLATAGAAAQQTGTVNGTPPTRESIVVLGNPLGTDSRDLPMPVSSLSGDALTLRRSGTLGSTLDGLPGVSSTWFGPNAGRPVIRGMDGDRVRVLTNLGGSFDASSLSPDHNPALDPLLVERIEILRGPGALLYGGIAIGGVVNVVDNRIPQTPIRGVQAAIDARAGGAQRERAQAALLEWGNGTFALHADRFARRSGDYRVPEATGIPSPVVNSAAQADGGAVGGMFFLPGGHGSIGASHSLYENRYGSVAEADVRIDMRQTRDALDIALRQLGGIIETLSLRGARTSYRHTEFEGAVAGTVFHNDGHDWRIEAHHAGWGAWRGIIGLQGESFDFSALGDEAFLPATRTRNSAVFIHEELPLAALRLSLGARQEHSSVRSQGQADGAPGRFGETAERRFALRSISLGAAWHIDGGLTLAATASRNERAPAYYELFADGPHLATAAYEVGDRNLPTEKATAFDIQLRWKNRHTRLALSVFAQRFRDFIALRRSGADRELPTIGDAPAKSDDGVTTLPEFRFQPVRARLRGAEAEAVMPILTPAAPGGLVLDLQARAHLTYADDLTHGEPLPRIAPLRALFGAAAAYSGFSLSTEVERVWRQARVPRNDARGATAGYSMMHVAATWRFTLGRDVGALLYLRGTNLDNKTAFNAASADTVRGLAPLPGRSIHGGIRLDF